MTRPTPPSPLDDPLATPDPAERYLDGRYAAANPGWHGEDARHKAAVVADLVDALGWRPRRLIDVGCGTGEVLSALIGAWPGVQGEGWDPAAPWPRPQPWLHGDSAWRDARADLVLFLDVLEHLDAPEAALRALREVAPRAVLRVPLEVSVLDLLRPARALEARVRWGHLHQWSLPPLRALVEASGWTLRAHRWDRVPPRPQTLRGRGMELLRTLGAWAAPDATATCLGGFSVLMALERTRMPHDEARS